MGVIDWVIAAVVLLILGLAGWYIYRTKKKGVRCIGCPEGGSCSCGQCNGCCEK